MTAFRGQVHKGAKDELLFVLSDCKLNCGPRMDRQNRMLITEGRAAWEKGPSIPRALTPKAKALGKIPQCPVHGPQKAFL